MRIWADVYDASGNRLGDGAVQSISSASWSRKLDGAGSWSFNVEVSDRRALELLANERRVKLYIEDFDTIRQIGTGIIRSRRLSDGAGGRSLTISGVDSLDELKRVNTLLARKYAGVTVGDVAQDIIALAPSWALIIDNDTLTSARFDGASVLKALQEIADQNGVHLRLGVAEKTVEIGAFGTPNGITLVQPQAVFPELYSQHDIAVIESISKDEDSEAIANWIVPLGQGEGESALTLQRSTRTAPYPIQTIIFNGKTHYYLADNASITAYGQIQKVSTFKQIGAVSNSDADLELAANALYDAAAYWLQRNAVKLDSYKVTIRKSTRMIRPGDKVRVMYDGLIFDAQGQAVDYMLINDEFWVMDVRESFGDGSSVQLSIANVDRVALDAATIIVGELEELSLRNLRIQTYPSVRSFVYRRELDPTHTAQIPILLTSTTTALHRAIVQLTSRPFRSTAGGAASGGGATSAAGGSSTQTATGGQIVNLQTGGGLGSSITNHTHQFSIPAHNHSVSIPSHTHTLPAHTHPQEYGISDDSQYPLDISIWIDGVDRTAALGGGWVGTGGVNLTLDITQFLVTAAGGLRQKHILEVRCEDGQGEIEATIELYETIQAIAMQ